MTGRQAAVLVAVAIQAFWLWFRLDLRTAWAAMMVVNLFLAGLLDRVYLVTEGVLYIKGFFCYAIPLRGAHVVLEENVVTIRWMAQKQHRLRLRANPELYALLNQQCRAARGAVDKENYPKTVATAGTRVWVGVKGWWMTGIVLGCAYSVAVILLTAITHLPFLLFLNALTPFLMCPKTDLCVLKEQGLWILEAGKQPQFIPAAEIVAAKPSFQNRGGFQQVAFWRSEDEHPIRATNIPDIGAISENALWKRYRRPRNRHAESPGPR